MISSAIDYAILKFRDLDYFVIFLLSYEHSALPLNFRLKHSKFLLHFDKHSKASTGL